MAEINLVGCGENLHSEYIRLLGSLPCHSLDVLAEFTEGRSGASVLLVDIVPIELGEPQGDHIAKIVQVRKNRNELLAHTNAQSFFSPYLPEIVMNSQERLTFGSEAAVSEGTFAAIVYSVATGSLQNARTLRITLQKHANITNAYIEGLSKIVYTVWETHVKTNSLKPVPLMKDNMLRSLAKGGSSVTNVAGQTMGLDNTRPLLSMPNTSLLLPNPIAYLEREEYWHRARGISFPEGPIHGDLHADNIICLTSNYMPTLIDFAGFDAAVCVFYDLLYLEMDILLTMFGTDVDSWHHFMRFLTKNWHSVERDPPGPATALHAARILRRLRQPAYKIAEKCGRQESFEVAFHLAATSVGLNFLRKAGKNYTPPNYLMGQMALLYAAYNLRRALIFLEVPYPEPERAGIAYPKQGISAELPENYRVKFGSVWQDEDQATVSVQMSPERSSSPADKEQLVSKDFIQLEIAALDFIERSLSPRTDIPIESIIEIAELIKNIREFRNKQRTSVGITNDQQIAYNGWSSSLQRLCLQIYGVSYTQLIQGYRPQQTTHSESEASAFPEQIDRLSFLEELTSLEERRALWLERRANNMEIAKNSNVPINQWIIRELQRIEERLIKIRSQTPPAWFDVRRDFFYRGQWQTELNGITSEQPIQARITIHNLGQESCRIVYNELISENVAIINGTRRRSSSRNRIRYEESVPPGSFSQFTYSFYVTEIGEATFDGELNYQAQITHWDSIARSTIVCSRNAIQPEIEVKRFYRYSQPGDTEILISLQNRPGNRIARALHITETYELLGQTFSPQLALPGIEDLRPGETVWISYEIEGIHRPDVVLFSPTNKVGYKDSAGVEYVQITESECQFLQYESLSSHKALVARDHPLAQIKNVVQSLATGDTASPQRVIYIDGPRGSGKTRLLVELECEAHNYDLCFISHQAERSSSPLARLIVKVMGAEVYDYDKILSALNETECFSGEGGSSRREVLARYLTESLDPSSSVEGLLTQAIFDLFRFYAESRPLVLALDDAHEFRSVWELDLLGKILLRTVASSIPIIFAFAETTEYVHNEHGTLGGSLSTQTRRVRNSLRISCQPLSETETYDLIEQLIDYPKFDAELKYFVYKLSHGIPQDIYDILQWLTKTGQALQLRGNLWTKASWISRDEAQFENITRILPRFAEEHFDTDVFHYLRILSVVGETIPLELAGGLHDTFFPNDDRELMYDKIDILHQFDFLRPVTDDLVRFSHLSRRNSIYEDSEFDVDGSMGKERIRQVVFELIWGNPAIYMETEQVLQAAHHLIRCETEFQAQYQSVLTRAARIALQRGDLRLGREFTDRASQATEVIFPQDMLQIMDLKQELAHRIIEVAGNYVEGLDILRETAEWLDIMGQRQSIPLTERETLQTSIIGIEAAIKLERATLSSVKSAVELSREAIHRLEKRKPFLIPFFSQPDLNRFDYLELLNAYLTHVRAILSLNDLDKTEGIARYGRLQYAEGYERKAKKLARSVTRNKKNDLSQVLRFEINMGDLHLSRQEYDRATTYYNNVLAIAERRNLLFFQGRALQRLGRASILRLFSEQANTKSEDYLSALFTVVTNANQTTEYKKPAEIELKYVGKLYARALSSHLKVDDLVGVAEAHAVLGVLNHIDQEYSKALSDYEAAIDHYSKVGQYRSRWICCLGALSIYLEQEDHVSASRIWHQTYDIYTQEAQDEQ